MNNVSLRLSKSSTKDLSSLATTIQKFEEKLLEAVEKGDAPGLAVAIVSRDKVHYCKGLGVKRLGFSDEVTPSTLFQLASISKPLSATLLALLKEQGLCSFKNNPNQYLPDLFKGNAYDNLTIENMLSHTSGKSYEGFEEMIESYMPRKTILEKLKQTPPSTQPGNHFEYHNVVYGLIGDIITSLTDQPLESVFKNYLFKPLGMDEACLGLPALLEAQDRAYPHVEDACGKVVPALHYSHAYYTFPTSGGVNASLKDLIPFIQLYLGKHANVISSDELKPLYAPTIQVPEFLDFLEDSRGKVKDVSYGLGWTTLNFGEERVVYHTGWLNGFRNFLSFLPDRDIGLVILGNTNQKVASNLGLEFLYLLLGD